MQVSFNFLADQWLGLHAFTAECPLQPRSQFNPCSGNQNPASPGAWPKKFHKVAAVCWEKNTDPVQNLRIPALVQCWRRLFRVPWTTRRSNQSILKEISPEYSLEGLMLKLQYFGHLMRRADSLEKTLMLRKIEGRRRKEQQDEMVGWHH